MRANIAVAVVADNVDVWLFESHTKKKNMIECSHKNKCGNKGVGIVKLLSPTDVGTGIASLYVTSYNVIQIVSSIPKWIVLRRRPFKVRRSVCINSIGSVLLRFRAFFCFCFRRRYLKKANTVPLVLCCLIAP